MTEKKSILPLPAKPSLSLPAAIPKIPSVEF